MAPHFYFFKLMGFTQDNPMGSGEWFQKTQGERAYLPPLGHVQTCARKTLTSCRAKQSKKRQGSAKKAGGFMRAVPHLHKRAGSKSCSHQAHLTYQLPNVEVTDPTLRVFQGLRPLRCSQVEAPYFACTIRSLFCDQWPIPTLIQACPADSPLQ